MDFEYTSDTIDPKFTGILTIAGTGGLKISAGTLAQRPTPVNGILRYNTSNNRVEAYQESNWTNFTDALYLPNSTYKTIQDFINIMGSRGTFSGGEFTDNGNGTIAVTGGTGQIHPIDSTLSQLYFFDFPTTPSLVLVDNALNNIFADYNAGNPQVIAIAGPDFSSNRVILGQVYRSGTTLTINQWTRLKLDNSFVGIINRFQTVNPFQRESGAILGASGVRNFSITPGVFWEGIDRITSVAKNTATGTTFTYWYRTATSTWASVPGQTQIDNQNYNDPTTGLVPLTNNRYGSHWIYLATNGVISVVYGLTNADLVTTQNSQPPPNPPNSLLTTALIGRIIIVKSAAVFTEVNSAYEVVFTGGAIGLHNDLGGIQGGAADDYFHTTQVQNTTLANLNILGNGIVAKTAASTFANRTLTAGTGISITNGDGIGGNPTISATGVATGTVTSVGLTAPAAGLTVTGTNPITSSGTFVLALADDLAALEGIATTGMAARTGGGVWTTRTITAGTGITVTDGGGLTGNPTIAATALVSSVSATAPAAGFTITGSPITTTGTLTFALSDDLAALEGIATSGFSTRTAQNTWTTRAITAGTGISITNGDGISGNPVISAAAGTGTVTSVAATPPAAGMTISGSPIATSGTFVFALANDLAAVEGIATTGFTSRTAAETWATRTLVAGAGITISNPDGIAGDPTIAATALVSSVTATAPAAGFTITGSPITTSGTLTFALSDDLLGVEGITTLGIVTRTATNAWTTRTITAGTGISISNGDGIAGNPTITANLDAVYVNVGGDTMTGTLTMSGAGVQVVLPNAPTIGTHAVNKDYVDATINGLNWKDSVLAATTANINLATGGLLTIDGITVLAGSRVLVRVQTTPAQNGIYIASAGAWTRSPDMDSTTPINEIDAAAVFVEQGTTLGDTAWVQVNTVTVLGTDPIAFVQFSAAGSYTAGNGLTLTGNQFSLTSPVTVANGGTGLTTTPTNGQLLIGNGSGYALSTITQGTGITITNGAGTISIAANSAALVTTFSAGTTGFTPSSATSGAITLAGTLAATNGGTGQTVYAVGDILYASTTTALSKLPDVATGSALISGGVNTAPSYGKIGLTTHVSGTLPVGSGGTNLTAVGTANQVLGTNNGATALEYKTIAQGTGITVVHTANTITINATGGGVTTFSAGTTGLTPSSATSGAVTLAGVLLEVNGGTGFSSYTVGDLLYASTTTILSKLADVATGNALISGGAGVAPSYGKIGLTTHVTGTLPITNGGTGLASGGSANQIIGVNNGVTSLEYKTVTAGTAISVGHNPNAITITNTGVTSIVAGTGISISGGTGAVTVNATAISSGAPKAISIQLPVTNDEATLFYTVPGVTISQINAVLRGSATPSVTWTILYGADRSAAGTAVITAGTTTTATTNQTITTFNSATIPAGNWIWAKVTAVSGTVTELALSVAY